jgi:hypothetical protein
VQGWRGASVEGYDEEVVVAEGFYQGIVVVVVDFDDSEVGVVGGEGGIAGMPSQGCDLMLGGTEEVGEDVGADLSGALMLLLVNWMVEV